mmetsp:Transcript_76511/g.234172  ORF Transcript_76511/g.234172 Transcript_76511/m.234172 type:complete len:647 (-) Transcript_76511:63-2003(-)
MLAAEHEAKRQKVGHKDAQLEAFIERTNVAYEAVHVAFERQFWGTKMGLAGEYSPELLTSTKASMEAFLASKDLLKETRAWMAKEVGDEDQRKTLAIFEKTILCYVMESEQAKQIREQTTALESKLEQARNGLKLGFKDPEKGGAFVELSSVGIRNRMRTSANEAVRKACYEEGLAPIGAFLVASGFPEIVRQRNRCAKALGFEDFYDMKVTQAEGFGKTRLFEILDTLEQGTRGLMETARRRLESEKGKDAVLPWNTGYFLAGDITQKLDPYFPFAAAVARWGRSFAALGIKYEGATMTLDLLDRKGKYSNGFCHWPQPAWVRSDGSWQPSMTNFTSLADPAAVGSGKVALTTLMHEAGHAAHFANIRQPSPFFSQERAPTSVAYAENQSMFLDSLVGDAAWRSRYAHNMAGEVLPFDLHEEELRATHPYEVFTLRGMLAVPYFEKALYELPEAELTAERIQQVAAEVELRVQGGPAARPLLTVPHILSDESSCCYHGYVLAEMSVHQTRAHFLKGGGHIVDNPEVGKALCESYWKPGNSAAFLELVEGLTGKPLTGASWVAELEKPIEHLIKEERADYDAGVAATRARLGADEARVDLGMKVRIVDGDEVIADSEAAGSFEAMCQIFGEYIQRLFGAKDSKAKL